GVSWWRATTDGWVTRMICPSPIIATSGAASGLRAMRGGSPTPAIVSRSAQPSGQSPAKARGRGRGPGRRGRRQPQQLLVDRGVDPGDIGDVVDLHGRQVARFEDEGPGPQGAVTEGVP